VVFQQWENGKNEENVVEEWCFSNGKKGKMLNSGVSAMGKKWENEENVVEEWCFSNGKNEENVVEQWCFSNGKNGRGKCC
jgi:hypothetical protein